MMQVNTKEDEVVPAQAGVILASRRYAHGYFCCSRASGGDPAAIPTAAGNGGLFPRKRG